MTGSPKSFVEFLEKAPNPIFVKDVDLRFVYVNKAFADWFGFRSTEVLGKRDADFYLKKSEVEHFRDADRRILNERRPYAGIERIFSPRGSVAEIRVSKVPLINEKGQVQGILGTFTRAGTLDKNDFVVLDSIANGSGLLDDGWGAYSLLQAYFSSHAGRLPGDSLGDLLTAKVSSREVYQRGDLSDERVLASLQATSPSLGVLRALQARRLNLKDLEWRVFEEIVAELLNLDGYKVELQPGRKDGGVDILAWKCVHPIGQVFSIWQAKQYRNRRVSINVVRELADSRQEFRASKGMIVTSSFLTKDALERIEKDRHTLGKIDKSDLLTWIDTLHIG